MKSLGKKGSHIEVIISFVIFVSALIALYAIVKPVIGEPIDKKYLVSYIKTQIQENTSDQLVVQYIDVTGNMGDKTCFILKDYNPNPPSLIVKYESEAKKNAYSTPNDNWLLIDFNKKGKYKIYYKDSFDNIVENNDLNDCDKLKKDEGYTIGDKKTLRYVFLSNIKILAEDYTENYAKIKEDYKIPAGMNFEFEFRDPAIKNILYQGTRPKSEKKNKEIYAEEIPVIYADYDTSSDDIKIKTGFLTVKVWSD